MLGVDVKPDALTVTIGFGASLFDGRYGLAARKPPGLAPMPVFPDDALVAAETHGDVLVQLCAGTQETLLNALRELMRTTRGALALRWKVEGFLPGETDDPGLAADPKGARIPLDSHIRLARPRTAETEDSRILRRSYNYSRGVDASGQLDMGLVFCCFQRDVERQFAAVQRRLAGEPLVDYVVPTGGGVFYLPPGAAAGQDWVGSRLFA